jgi:hypothetical protein
VGQQFRVNVSTAGNQSFSDDEVALKAVAATADGGFIVAWRSTNSDGNNWGVVAQRFDAGGSALGSEIKVNTTTNGEQRDPSVAVLADGKFVIVWMDSNDQDGGTGKDSSGWGVYGQLFDVQGLRVGNEFLVNTSTSQNQYWPNVTSLAGGGFVVNWRDDDKSNVGAQLFDASASKVGVQFTLNSYGVSGWPSQWWGSTASLPDGGFWAVWTTDVLDGSGRGVYLQRFAADGKKVGAEIRVNTYTDNSQQSPQIDAWSDGSFVVTWASVTQDGSGWGIYAQRFDASGSPVGG